MPAFIEPSLALLVDKPPSGRFHGQNVCAAVASPAVRDALIGFMAATAQAQAAKAAQRAGIEHAKQNGDRAYLGRSVRDRLKIF
jgi:hypothetical protein